MNLAVRSKAVRSLGGVAAIAACYVYFLIFAQFAFLRLAEADGLGAGQIRWIMGVMGAAGVLSSLAMRRVCVGVNIRSILLGGFAVSAVAAWLAPVMGGLAMRCATAGLIGLGLGVTTVGLAASAPAFFGAPHRGILIGAGTGLAYAICNIPSIFAGTPAFQSGLAAGACVLGAAAVWIIPGLGSGENVPASGKPSPAFGILLLLFFALVWLDSASFYTLQSTPELNRFGWATSELQWTNALIHLTAACLGGMWLDRGGILPLLATAYGGLAVAGGLVAFPDSFAAPAVHWAYAAGVSLYSTALVFAPASGGGAHPAVLRRAGVLYAVAGWIGSALGIGMAQDLHRIPFWFLGLSGGLIGCTLFYGRKNR